LRILKPQAGIRKFFLRFFKGLRTFESSESRVACKLQNPGFSAQIEKLEKNLRMEIWKI